MSGEQQKITKPIAAQTDSAGKLPLAVAAAQPRCRELFSDRHRPYVDSVSTPDAASLLKSAIELKPALGKLLLGDILFDIFAGNRKSAFVSIQLYRVVGAKHVGLVDVNLDDYGVQRAFGKLKGVAYAPRTVEALVAALEKTQLKANFMCNGVDDYIVSQKEAMVLARRIAPHVKNTFFGMNSSVAEEMGKLPGWTARAIAGITFAMRQELAAELGL